MIIIGVCGQPSSGKDTAADYFERLGFKHFSNSDRIREDMRKEGLALDRNVMREFATKNRLVIGAFYPVNEICPHVTTDAVITGFRNTAEVKYAKEFFGDDFILVALEAPFELRYERAKNRNRTGDDITIEKFRDQEEAERNNNPESHEVDNVIALADHYIENSGTEAELLQKIEKLITSLTTG